MIEERPNPDTLLREIQQETKNQQRGKLKIFFGSCAGVGKTYAMLQAAQKLKTQNIDVVIGLVESHGRAETGALLTGLELLPTQSIEYHKQLLSEFDLAAALQRKPAVILIDELAHTNLQGLRHSKRWQDVQELLDAGIHVYTTLNVQHIESLNDVVAQITGIHVFETIPDHVFDKADEVTLVDLSPEELLLRLKQGKIYVPELTKQAIRHFFRKGNLIALRELALRRMADRIDLQMREYRTDEAIQPVWQAKERLLVCLGPDQRNEGLLRKAYRLANRLHADWIAVYVETPAAQKFSANKRRQIIKALKMARELGADTHILAGADLSGLITEYARSRNTTKIILGSTQRNKLSRLFSPTLAEKLIDKMSDIDIYVVGLEPKEAEAKEAIVPTFTSLEFEATPKLSPWGYLWAGIVCGLLTFLSAELTHYLALTNVAMLYLLGVVLVSSRYGRGPGIVASFLSVAAFAFFFISPEWSLNIIDSPYLITFTVMLIVALAINHLTVELRSQTRIAIHRERRTRAIYTLNKELSAALSLPQILAISQRHIKQIFRAQTVILLPDTYGKVHLPVDFDHLNSSTVDLGIAQWVYDHREAAGVGTPTLPASPLLYLPLVTPVRKQGVIALALEHHQAIFLPEQQRLLDNFITQTALALERARLRT